MTARLTVIALAAILAFGAIGTAFALTGGEDDAGAVDTVELRKDDASAEVLVEEDDDGPGDGDSTRGDDGTRGGDNTGDGDRTRGNDGTSGGDNTGDGDRTRGNDGTSGGDNTGDGDGTWGNDGTGGGDNPYVAPAPVYGGGDSGGGTTG
jgi:hypothetical protein